MYKRQVLGAAMPTLVLGAGLGVVAIMTGNLVCLYLAEFMTLGGGGDFLIIMKILRYHSCLLYTSRCV